MTFQLAFLFVCFSVFLVFFLFLVVVLFCFGLLGQGFSVTLKPFLELAPVDQVGLEQTEILVPLHTKAGIKGV